MLDSSPNIAELEPWMEVRFARSGGPGGQHVNKVSTRVTLLLDFEHCPCFDTTQRRRIARRLATRLAHDGRLRVVSQRERSQRRNRAAAEQRLIELLVEALRRRRPRRPTRPTRGSRERRLREKRLRGETKRRRGAPPME